MGVRTGAQFLDGLRKVKRQLWIEGEPIEDVTEHPRLRGAARTLAAVFDRQHEFPEDCLTRDPETGEPINVSHMMPRSRDDLRLRAAGLSRISEFTVGLMGRTPDYLNVKFACMAARWRVWLGAGELNKDGAENLIAFQKRLRREDICLTHTITLPNNDKRTDMSFVGNKVALRKVGETRDAIVVRGTRILGTLAPFADELAVYPALTIPATADEYAVAFSIPVDLPGLKFLCRDNVSVDGNAFDWPLSSRYDEQDALVIFDNVEIPKKYLFLDGRPGSALIYNSVGASGGHTHLIDSLSTHSTIRGLNKLEFAYGLATRLAESIGDYSASTQEMLGEILIYTEICRSAVRCSIDEAYETDGVWFSGGRALTPARTMLPIWLPRVNEIITLIGSHNFLVNPSRRLFDDAKMRPLIDEFLFGANGVTAEDRVALFRLAWDFVGSGFAGRNTLYERFYQRSATTNKIAAHSRNKDRSRSYALVDAILADGKAKRS